MYILCIKEAFCYEKKVKINKALSLGIVGVMAFSASGVTNEKLTLAKSTESSDETCKGKSKLYKNKWEKIKKLVYKKNQ